MEESILWQGCAETLQNLLLSAFVSQIFQKKGRSTYLRSLDVVYESFVNHIIALGHIRKLQMDVS